MKRKKGRPDGRAASDGEVFNAFEMFPPVDKARLRRLAFHRARRFGNLVQGNDLIHEALLATADGSRPWTRSTSLLEHLMGAICSISHNEYETLKRRSLKLDEIRVAADSAPGWLISEYRYDLTPERQAMGLEELQRACDRLEEVLEDDESGLAILDFYYSGLGDWESIRRGLNLSPTKFSAAYKRFRRAIEKVDNELGGKAATAALLLVQQKQPLSPAWSLSDFLSQLATLNPSVGLEIVATRELKEIVETLRKRRVVRKRRRRS